MWFEHDETNCLFLFKGVVLNVALRRTLISMESFFSKLSKQKERKRAHWGKLWFFTESFLRRQGHHKATLRAALGFYWKPFFKLWEEREGEREREREHTETNFDFPLKAFLSHGNCKGTLRPALALYWQAFCKAGGTAKPHWDKLWRAIESLFLSRDRREKERERERTETNFDFPLKAFLSNLWKQGESSLRQTLIFHWKPFSATDTARPHWDQLWLYPESLSKAKQTAKLHCEKLWLYTESLFSKPWQQKKKREKESTLRKALMLYWKSLFKPREPQGHNETSFDFPPAGIPHVRSLRS